MTLKLFYTPGACSMVPHIALEEARADFERVPVDFAKGDQLTPEYLRINPKGRVPALLTDPGVITEIPAILGYIGRSFPEARLAPWQRSEERRVGKECVSTCISRWSRYPKKKNTKK